MTKTALIAVAAVAAIVVASWVTTPNFNVNVNPVVSAGQFEFDSDVKADNGYQI